MPCQDDPTISGDVVLFRRIPPQGDRVTWTEEGYPLPSSFNFKDQDDELSLNIAQETSPNAVLAGHEGFGLVYTAEQIREICRDAHVKICRDEEDPANGHVLVCGKISGGMAKRLSKIAQWVQGRWPARLDPISGQPVVPESG